MSCIDLLGVPFRYCIINENGNDATGEFSIFLDRIFRRNRPFRTVAGAIRARLNDPGIPPDRKVQATLTSDITEGGNVQIPRNFVLASGDNITGSYNVGLVRRWTVNGNISSVLTSFASIHIIANNYNANGGCVYMVLPSRMELRGQLINTRGENKNKNKATLTIDGKADVRIDDLTLIGDAAVEVKSGSLEVNGGQVTIIKEIPITRTPIQISKDASVVIIKTNLQYETQDLTPLFYVEGELRSTKSEYTSNSNFVFHDSHSPNIYHMQDILDINDGVKDIVRGKQNKVKYINVVNKADNSQLINTNTAQYSFFLDNGDIVSSSN
ncbi:Hypothetical protein ORPV_108 [Orpheovirus IHUMI-LCC2]|uniref:Uncharacterized protein n=1 Tax=Orpheovirus IHUMI-LCC2 TaxID=2023057 RepID=A0A2I2L399_9VIRU|nr:Hypothetical protein ORPV_108 [Orpheovirus IHUMI-LCC2]SNW62012.1 Hypothetical protein ORPV_108 [Orpheovirus IHUMI-LCC2]